MPLTNFRAVRERFSHIDAEFVSCSLDFNGESHYAVRFYPWWEHPRFLSARAANERWGFKGYEDGAQVVTVYPRGLVAAAIEPTSEVTDWAFIEGEHHLLWPYEDTGDVMCKVPLPAGTLGRLPKLIQRELTVHAPCHMIASFLAPFEWDDPMSAETLCAGFALGCFPRSVFSAVRSVLNALEVRFYTVREPEDHDLPVLFLIDDHDYIVADDFDIDVPEFRHDDAWFQP